MREHNQEDSQEDNQELMSSKNDDLKKESGSSAKGSESSISDDGDSTDTTNVENESSLEAKYKSLQNDFLYLRAEFDNFRKRQIKERSDLIRYGSERLIVLLLDILDNFDRSLNCEITSDNIDVFKNGVLMISKEFKTVLNQSGVSAIECDGQPFDPAIHEAIGSEESDEVKPGFILRTFRKPYKLHDRIIRPGQVVIAKVKG